MARYQTYNCDLCKKESISICKPENWTILTVDRDEAKEKYLDICDDCVKKSKLNIDLKDFRYV